MSLSEQIVKHEEQLKELKEQLEDHKNMQLHMSSKRSIRQTFEFKKEFLTNEIKRYDVYKSILEEKKGPC